MNYAHTQNEFTHNGCKNYQVIFRSGVDIDCRPPYVKGKQDSTWVTTTKPLPRKDDLEAWENLIGMRLLPL